jgi:cytoskeletal protein RodZ
MEYLISIIYLLFVVLAVAALLGIFWLVFYYTWKTIMEFRKKTHT